MAALVLSKSFSLAQWHALAVHLRATLARYAVPVFIRVLPTPPVTSTFKHVKKELRDEGADPTRVTDPLFVLEQDAYVELTLERWHSIVAGRTKL